MRRAIHGAKVQSHQASKYALWCHNGCQITRENCQCKHEQNASAHRQQPQQRQLSLHPRQHPHHCILLGSSNRRNFMRNVHSAPFPLFDVVASSERIMSFTIIIAHQSHANHQDNDQSTHHQYQAGLHQQQPHPQLRQHGPLIQKTAASTGSSSVYARPQQLQNLPSGVPPCLSCLCLLLAGSPYSLPSRLRLTELRRLAAVLLASRAWLSSRSAAGPDSPPWANNTDLCCA